VSLRALRLLFLYWSLLPSRRFLPLATCALALAGFYLYNLSGVGMLGPDEPRYAAISQAMGHGGDLVTPHLWGSPWFEKPPLLYWMSAAFFWLGARPELAARLPVALLSLVFLAATAWLVMREFGAEASAVSVSLLASCAGWVSYSNLGLTDLPMAAFFSLAVLLALPLLRADPDLDGLPVHLLAIGVCLGWAVLAKGLVPLVLAAPLAWFLRRWWRWWGLAALSFLMAAGPWYIAVYSRNGAAFVKEFFLKQHFARLYSSSLQHVQPWYYYLPILLGALFPWTPLFAVFFRRHTPWDRRRTLLLATVLFGLLFFSVSLNKLPGYLLPLLPLLFVLLGAEFEQRSFPELGKKWLIPCAFLIALIPLIAKGLPDALAAGKISAFHVAQIAPTELFYVAAPLAVVLWGRRSWLNVLLVLCVAAGGILLKATAYRYLDESVSARGLWREIKKRKITVCDGGINRDWIYGLSFYQGREVPPCGDGGVYDRQLHANGRARPSLDPK
jgi:4-amino-4-deoxy-L-arabinose transferase-like glycosyltransferase